MATRPSLVFSTVPSLAAFAPTHSGATDGGTPANLVVPASGKLDFETLAPGLSLSTGPGAVLDAVGTAIVVHAKADDHRSQPSGDSGDRIACGVLTR